MATAIRKRKLDGIEAARLAAKLDRAARRRERANAGELPGDPEMLADGVVTIDAGKGENPEVGELRAQRDEYLEMARRERAEFDNYRKRVTREMENLKRESLSGFLKEFFGPLDELDRALSESEKNDSYEALQSGVRLVSENLWKALAKAGVKKINAQGKPFNPEFHEAMASVPSSDVPPNTVLEVFDNGYKLDGFVLRPARVVVSREP
ncbi:MAG: nucleotide exchange factor GrpE [Planctomycetota bacterium]|jgi:molecular chaperone GrpE|nr:nucleotide exchange factor GrpE [Planctomycetota bacterium]